MEKKCSFIAILMEKFFVFRKKEYICITNQ